MTFAASSGKVSYDGDGSSSAFPTVFKFVLNGHVKAILRDAGDVETLWAEGSDYTLSGAGNDAGGTLTATVAPADGETLILLLDVPLTQEKSLPLGGAFPSTQVEEMGDLAAMGLAKLSEVDRRTLKVPESDKITGSDLDLPIDSARAGKFLAFDQNGRPTPAVGTTGGLSPVSAYMDTLLPSADAAAGRATLDAQRDLVTAGLITAHGDLIVGNATPAPARLAKGAANQLLGVGANDVAYFGGTLAKSANYTAQVSDHRKLILVDATAGPVTITLPAAATAGDGFEVAVKKIDAGSELVTVDGDGAETFDGAAARVLSQQYDVEIYLGDGSAWYLVTKRPQLPGLLLVAKQQAVDSGVIDFANLSTEFDHYILECINVRPGTDQVELYCRFSDDNGVSFKAGATDYSYVAETLGAAFNDTKIKLHHATSASNGLGNALNEFSNFRIDIWRPATESTTTYMSANGLAFRAGPNELLPVRTIGRYKTAAKTDAIRIFMSGGNIAEGQFNLYGVRV